MSKPDWEEGHTPQGFAEACDWIDAMREEIIRLRKEGVAATEHWHKHANELALAALDGTLVSKG